MKEMTFLKTISILLFIGWQLPSQTLCQTNLSRQSVTDHLVQDLSCENLTVDSIFQAISVDRAFNPSQHIPLRNWSFQSGPYRLANCWSLSRSQRLIFYLGQFPDAQLDELTVLNMLRGSEPYSYSDGPKEWYKIPYTTFPWNSETFEKLLKKQHQDIGQGTILDRHFKAEVEHYQNYRFHDLIRNFKFILDGRERSPDENKSTIQYLQANLKKNRLTLVLIRASRWVQHVVLAKKISQNNNNEIQIEVYDSNQPDRKSIFTYNQSEKHFYAPQLIQGLQGVTDIQSPVGLFIVDEKETTFIGKTLLKHYQAACGEHHD
ncbi:MAG: hypothetical protein BroJett041_23800 [Candidatus Jettenia caeni]|nr:MAG: hypothetical protein BroJett041_23800 [Candidatus Jettenia caeni]